MGGRPDGGTPPGCDDDDDCPDKQVCIFPKDRDCGDRDDDDDRDDGVCVPEDPRCRNGYDECKNADPKDKHCNGQGHYTHGKGNGYGHCKHHRH
jgi:hypothetical protein